MTTSLLMSKIIDISDARKRRNREANRAIDQSNRERRNDFRRPSEERLFIQIVGCEDQELIGTTISCKALDVSGGGLKISIEQYLPAGCELDLWVDINSRPGKFFLSSDVKWVRPGHSDGYFVIGVELRDGAATDIIEWRSAYH